MELVAGFIAAGGKARPARHVRRNTGMMNIAIVSQMRMFRECIAEHLGFIEPGLTLVTESSVAALIEVTFMGQPNVTIVDVTLGFDQAEIGLLSAKWPDMPLLALGLLERREEVIHHGRAGFAGYVSRDASLDDLRSAIMDAAAGRLRCPAEITGGLIRALFDYQKPAASAAHHDLTRREMDVLHLVGRGNSNKEIARALHLSLATVKSHLHNIFSKLGVATRSQALRQIRSTPSIGQFGVLLSLGLAPACGICP
jgi:DNA-binding NarL/FixJ family response regulator